MSAAGYSAMSSMLTPASPSASASSAIVPGRLATTIRSSRSGPAVELGARAGGGGPRRPRPCQAAIASRSPPRISARGLAAAAAPPLRPRRRRPRRCWRRCRPRSPGWRRRRGSCRGSSARPRAAARSRRSSAVAASATRALASTCGRWLTVAIRRSWDVGVDRLRAGAEAGDGPLQAVVEQPAGALGRGQVPAGALEEVVAGVLDPGRLGPGQRVAADEALVVAERGDELALGRADVGDDASPARRRRAPRGPAPAGPRPAPRRRPRRRPRRPRRASRRRGRARRPRTARSRASPGSGS